jgi:hypothetical protein
MELRYRLGSVPSCATELVEVEMSVGRFVVVGLLGSWALSACGTSSSSSGPGGAPEGGAGGSAGGETTLGGAGGEATGGAVTGGAGGTAALPPTCFAGPAECDPRTNEGCDAGQACDVGQEDGEVQLLCYPPPNEAALGAECNLTYGPFCQGGLVCGPAGACIPFCCGDEECTGPNEVCNPIATELGTLGGCIDPETIPDCSPPGGPCSENADCCSMDCHNDHCH